MATPEINPVYDRLTNNHRLPSERAARWIAVAAGAAGSPVMFALLESIRPLMQSFFAYVLMFAPGVIVAIVCLPVGITLAAMITARYAISQDYALLRLTHLSAETIVEGYENGTQHRLRVVRAVGFWFPVGSVAGASVFTIPIAVFGCSGLSCAGETLHLLVLALLPLTILMLLFTTLWRSMVIVGVWLGLRWAHSLAVTGAGALAALILGILIVAASAATLWGGGALMCLTALLLMPIFTISLERLAHAAAIGFVGGQSSA